MINFDVVIPVGIEECLIVKKNIKYIRENIAPNKIYIITKNVNFIFFSDKYKKKFNVELLDENKFIDELSYSLVASKTKIPGWYFQQFIKMGFALSSYAKNYYLIWDADTIPLNPITFFNEGKMLFANKWEDHEPYHVTIKKLLNIDKQVNFSFIAEHMIIDVKIMINLIDSINESEIRGKRWFDKILNSLEKNALHSFSEYETYGNYFMKYYSELGEIRYLRTYRCAGLIFGRSVTDKQLSLLHIDHDIVSFERQHLPIFPYNVLHLSNRLFLRTFKFITEWIY